MEHLAVYRDHLIATLVALEAFAISKGEQFTAELIRKILDSIKT